MGRMGLWLTLQIHPASLEMNFINSLEIQGNLNYFSLLMCQDYLIHFPQKYSFFFISTIGGSEEYVLTAKTRILQEVFTCAYGWRHWRACHLSSWWWSYHTAGHGSPLPSVETTEAASLWQSYHLTDRSPGYRRSDGTKEDSETVRKVESESELAFIKI